MTEVGPKTPRLRDERFLAFLRVQPCCICRTKPTQAAHIRMGSIKYDKRPTGLQERPSDKWATPLCFECHRTQHTMSEEKFWADRGRDPFAIAQKLYAIGGRPEDGEIRRKKRKQVMPRGFGPRTIPSRPFRKVKRGFSK